MNIQRQLDDSEDTIEKLKAERDEAERNLEQTMKELGEIAWITFLNSQINFTTFPVYAFMLVFASNDA